MEKEGRRGAIVWPRPGDANATNEANDGETQSMKGDQKEKNGERGRQKDDPKMLRISPRAGAVAPSRARVFERGWRGDPRRERKKKEKKVEGK